jgi:TatD DNase family protein
LIEILESHPLPTRGFLLHSYAGSAELIPRLVKLGAYFSFSGSILKPHKRATREIFQQVPTDRLLIETDAPNMLPPDEMVQHPLPGKTNHPANLIPIHQQASHFLDTSLITNNFLRLFSF